MIDWVKTKAKFGYGKEELPRTSKKRVVWRCDNENCQAPHDVREREYDYAYVHKKQLKAKEEGGVELCQKCSHAHRKGKISEKKTDSAIKLPPQINVEKTLSLQGEDPRTMKPWARKKIVLTCDCGRDCVTTRAQINNYKSIKETGEFKCTACWTKDRREGVSASEETKRLMSESQKMRRVRENDEDKRRAEEFKKQFAPLKEKLDRGELV